AFPCSLVSADYQAVCITHQRKSQQQRLFRKFLQPAVVRKLRIAQTELVEALRASINQCRHTKFLREAPKLAERGWAFQQVYEVGPDLRSEKKRRALRVSGLFLTPKICTSTPCLSVKDEMKSSIEQYAR